MLATFTEYIQNDGINCSDCGQTPEMAGISFGGHPMNTFSPGKLDGIIIMDDPTLEQSYPCNQKAKIHNCQSKPEDRYCMLGGEKSSLKQCES